METPQKGSHKRRFQTTTASDRNDTRLFTQEDERRGRLSTEIAVETIKKKLYFASEQEQRCKMMSQQQPQIQRRYRQKMLGYLNAKFATALAKTSAHNKPQQQTNNSKPRQDCRLKERIASAFQEFMQSARAQNMSGAISEFQVGSLLKDMHFIGSLLDQRGLVLRLCKQLKAMRVECLFIFVLHLHVLHSEGQICESRKQEIVEQVRKLLENEGIAVSSFQLRQFYDGQEGSGRGEESQAMRARRAGRQTQSSMGHSLSRGKGG